MSCEDLGSPQGSPKDFFLKDYEFFLNILTDMESKLWTISYGKSFQMGSGVLLTQMNKTCQKSIIDGTTHGKVTTVLIFTYCIESS